ncbi:MAG: type II toxin-antitoxin system VapC family toxin, partial [Thermoflexales bacterium]
MIDASVIVKAFVGGDAAEACVAILESVIGHGGVSHAPGVIYYKVAGALRRYEMRAGYATMRDDIATLEDLALTTVPARELLLPAVEIAHRHAIGMSDAFYVALSERLRIPLITVDRRLVAACA